MYRVGREYKFKHGYYGYIQIPEEHSLYWVSNKETLSERLNKEVVYANGRVVDSDVFWYVGFLIRKENFYKAERELFDVEKLLNDIE